MKGGKAKGETRKADSRLAVKRKGSERASKRPAKKAEKDPNKPKRAPSAFFVFLKQFKEKHPENKSVAAVGKAAGEKWKSMSDAEKAPYVNKSNKRKAELQKSVSVASEKKKDESNNAMEEEDESDKSKSEVNDEDDESGEEEEGDDE